MSERGRGSRVRQLLSRLAGGAVLTTAALLAAAGLLAVSGHDPLASIRALVTGAVGGPARIGETLRQTVPLLGTGLGVTVALRAGLFNIGGEGQLYAGALLAVLAGRAFGDLSPPLALPALLIAGAVGGGALGALAGWMRARLSMNEVIVTILMNFVVFYGVSWIVHGPLRDRQGGGYPWTEEIPAPTRLPALRVGVVDLPAGLIVGLLLAVAVWVLLYRTNLGFEMRVTGDAPDAAAFARIPVARRLGQALMLAGVLCGLGGALELIGHQYRLSDFFSPGYGFTGIAVALVGAARPAGVVVAAFVFGALTAGAASMERTAQVPSAIATVVQGISIVLLVVARSAWLSRVRSRLVRTAGPEAGAHG